MYPREHVLRRRVDRGRDRREPALEWEQVAVDRAKEAVGSVPAEPGTPVEGRLEESARDRCCDSKRDRRRQCARNTEPGQLAAFEQSALPHAEAVRTERIVACSARAHRMPRASKP